MSIENLEPHQQRVVEELAELDGKRAKLTVFVSTPFFNSLLVEDRGLLKRQLEIMDEYSTVLGKRIARFATKP